MIDLIIHNTSVKGEMPTTLNILEKPQFKNAEVLKIYRTKFKKGKEARKKEDFTMAYIFFKDALYYAKCINWKEAILFVILEVADIDLLTNKCNRAYKHYMKCLNFALMNDLDALVSIIYFKLSKYYSFKGNSTLSKEYNERAIKATSKNN